jgi:hypothetical protein
MDTLMLWVKGTGVANVGVGNTRQTVAQLICQKPSAFVVELLDMSVRIVRRNSMRKAMRKVRKEW